MSRLRSDSAEARRQLLQSFQGLVELAEDESEAKEHPTKKHKSKAAETSDVTMEEEGMKSRGFKGRGRSRDRSSSSIEQLTIDMARLLIRHEDSLQTLKQNSSFILHVKTKSPVLPLLLRVSRKWKDEREQVLRLDLPLRSVLLACLLQDLLRRVTRVQQLQHLEATHVDYSKAQAELDQYKASRIIGDGGFLSKSWNGKELEVIPGTLSVEDASNLLQRLAAAITDPEIVQKFNSMRPLADTYAGQTLPFFLEVGWRHKDSATVWEDLNGLCTYTMFELQSAQLRRTTLQRSPLAKDILEQMKTISRRT